MITFLSTKIIKYSKNVILFSVPPARVVLRRNGVRRSSRNVARSLRSQERAADVDHQRRQRRFDGTNIDKRRNQPENDEISCKTILIL